MRSKSFYIFCIVLTILMSSCKPTKNTSPPDYLKNIVVYKEGYDAIAVYFILADSSGAMTASNGLVTLDISLKREFPLERRTRPSRGFNDELMNRILEKEAEFDSIVKKSSDASWSALVSSVYAGKKTGEASAAAMRAGSKYDKQIEAARESLIDLQNKLINRHKASRTQVPKEYFPLWAVLPTTIYLNHFDVKIKDFKNTKVGIGAFEREALICSIGRILFSELASLYEANDVGILKVEFETPDGKVLRGEETFYFK